MDISKWAKQPLIYLAGPYTRPDPVQNTSHAITVAKFLEDMYDVAVIVPHLSLLSHLVHPRDIDHWYAYDLQILHRCDALVRMPGDSTGADMEVSFAIAANIPVFMTDDKKFGDKFRNHWQKPEWGYGA